MEAMLTNVRTGYNMYIAEYRGMSNSCANTMWHGYTNIMTWLVTHDMLYLTHGSVTVSVW